MRLILFVLLIAAALGFWMLSPQTESETNSRPARRNVTPPVLPEPESPPIEKPGTSPQPSEIELPVKPQAEAEEEPGPPDLASYTREYWRGYYEKENGERIAALGRLLTLSDAQMQIVRDAFTRERDGFNEIWDLLAREHAEDPLAWITSADYAQRINSLTQTTDGPVLALLDPEQTRRYLSWRPDYNRGRYYWK